MDAERYYIKKKDGSYVIHFSNYEGISPHELEKLFSTFGKVLSIEIHEQLHGLSFVRYQNIQDVKHCLNGLQNHQYIKILPQKFKSINKSKINMHPSKYLFQEQSCFDQSKKSKTYKFGTNTKFYNQRDNQSTSSDCSNISSGRSVDTDDLVVKSPFVKHLVGNNFEKSYDTNEIPSLICSDRKRISTSGCHASTETIVPAQEIIVANVHPIFGIHYILHLFEKYNPISISLMRTIPRTEIRYCHVYFKTYEEALATERRYDKHNLYGNNLIVLRWQKLMEEAIST